MKNLKRIRQKRNITQSKLATDLNIKQESISAYEQGKSYPNIETLIKIADYLNTSIDYLLGRIENDTPIKDLNIKEMNPKTYRMLNNFIMLNDTKKDDVIWYSEAIRKK